MQNISGTLKHFSFCNFVNGNATSFWLIFAHAAFGIFISFGAFAETSLFIPRDVVFDNVNIKVFGVVEPSFDLRLHFEVDRTDNFVELYAPIPFDGEMVSDESSSKETSYSEKLCIFLKNFVDFFKHHFQFIAWTIFGFICGYGLPANVKWTP